MLCAETSHGQWHHLSLLAADKTEKHLVMRMVAQFVESRGCDAIIEVGEMWTADASLESLRFTSDLEHFSQRGEALAVLLATRGGLVRTYMTPIRRGRFGGIKLGETTESDGGVFPYFVPVIEVWGQQVKFRAQDGTQSEVWEPDTLDSCPCGGPKRYGECCKSWITSQRDKAVLKKKEKEVGPDISCPDPRSAEEAARGSLAQYVIWIKQHTAAAMNSGGTFGRKFYEQMVAVDALALECLVMGMITSLSAAEKADLILPQLRALRQLVGVQRLSMRLIAITCRWLFDSHRPEEAVLELDALGNISKLEDSLALSLVAQHFDLAHNERKKVLQRAVEVAACSEEKHAMKLKLASYLLGAGEASEALTLVQSIIDEATESPFARSAARILLWKITQREEDFPGALAEMGKDDEEKARYANAAYLIDSGKYEEAENLLGKLVEAGQVLAKLLLTDARLRQGAKESARDLFSTIKDEDVTADLQFVYAHAMCLLVLAGGITKLRDRAVGFLEHLPAVGGEQDEQVKTFLQLLKA